MFYWILLVIALVVIILWQLWHSKRPSEYIAHRCREHNSWYHDPSIDTIRACNNGCKIGHRTSGPFTLYSVPFGWWAVLGTGLFIASCFVSGFTIFDARDVDNSFYYLEEAEIQRDGILDMFDDVLSNEDYIELMNAATPEDIEFLNHRPEVTAFLHGRADKLIQVNSRVFRIRNELLEKSKEVCNVVQNPLIPQLPFFSPDCKLGEVLDLTSERSEENDPD